MSSCSHWDMRITPYLQKIDGDCIPGLRAIEGEGDDAWMLGDWLQKCISLGRG